jgi:hypothetical protein
MDTAAKIDVWFQYHAPTDDDIPKYVEIRKQARALAHRINELVPDCADKTAALRKLRECVMTANAAIACKGV